MQEIDTYITVLCDSLFQKLEAMKVILNVTKMQNSLLAVEDIDVEEFDDALEKKAIYIDKILQLDRGFDDIFGKVDSFLKENAEEYKPQILEMQNYIRAITDIGVEIESLEKENKVKFNRFLQTNRNKITEFRKNNKTAVSYYRNMSNQHQEWQSYFVDKKK